MAPRHLFSTSEIRRCSVMPELNSFVPLNLELIGAQRNKTSLKSLQVIKVLMSELNNTYLGTQMPIGIRKTQCVKL